MFDTQECIEIEDTDVEIVGDGGRNKHDPRSNRYALNRHSTEAASKEEDIELQEMGGHCDDQNEQDVAAITTNVSRRSSRADKVVSAGAPSEQGGGGHRTLEEHEDTSVKARDVPLCTVSERIATFGRR